LAGLLLKQVLLGLHDLAVLDQLLHSEASGQADEVPVLHEDPIVGAKVLLELLDAEDGRSEHIVGVDVVVPLVPHGIELLELPTLHWIVGLDPGQHLGHFLHVALGFSYLLGEEGDPLLLPVVSAGGQLLLPLAEPDQLLPKLSNPLADALNGHLALGVVLEQQGVPDLLVDELHPLGQLVHGVLISLQLHVMGQGEDLHDLELPGAVLVRLGHLLH